MIKFLLISLVIWFVITKIMRFKFIIYNGSPNQNRQRKEGTINFDKSVFKKKGNKDTDGGEYVDYEEVR